MAKNDERIDALEKRIGQLQAQRQALLARQRKAARKLDTRRKIILGGTVIMAMREGDPAGRQIFDLAIAKASARDLPLLTNWEPTEPTT